MPNDEDLARAGWRQGSVVRRDEHGVVVDDSIRIPAEAEIIVISHSCDIAQGLEQEPSIELLIAQTVSRINGNYSHNKNPRILHSTLTIASDPLGTATDVAFELRFTNKLVVPRQRLFGCKPDVGKQFSQRDLVTLAAWLGARYRRPELPTAFNDALERVDHDARRRRKLAKALNPHASGIYLELFPNAELAKGQTYGVNLLALVPRQHMDQHNAIEQHLKDLAALLREAGMDVKEAVKFEEETSVAMIRRFLRFNFDDISERDQGPFGVET